MGKSRWNWKVLVIVTVALAVMLCGYAYAANEVVLRFLCFQVGVHPDAPWVEKAVNDFNKEYAGKIKVVIDGVAGDQACWEKLRTDAAADTMPDIFMIKADRSEFNVLAQSGRVLDLNPYVAADPTFKARLNDKKSLATYSHEGQLLGVPFGKAYVGIFYNKDLFAKAGIKEFPVTWDEFFTVCATLKKSGITPMSLMTGENAWCSALMIAHFLGTTPEGQAWLEGTPEEANFMDPVFIDAVAKLQILLNEYTTPDAVGAGYGIAANYFLQSRTAMIANGPWMIGSFSDPKSAPPGFEEKVVYALAPGSGVIAMENVGYASGSKTKVKQDAAIEFLEFLMREEVYAPYLSITGQAPTIQVDMSRVTYNPINQEFIPKALEAKFKYDIVPNAVKPAVIDSFCQLMPGLADKSMAPEEFARRCQEISDKN
ncbi:MAG: extracellular solute-binding protein [Firmicutes bacterium]|nr:extracellular solute-binding protein [Bacillota bacterium]